MIRLSSLILATICGCATTDVTTAVQQAEVAAYGGEELQCVQLATTKVQADSCIAAVKTHWCGDGGALSAVDACSLGGDK